MPLSTLANQCLCMRFSVISGQPVFPAFSPRARKSSFLRCYRHQKLLFPRDKQAHQPTSSQHPLLHPPYTLPLNTRPPSHGHTPYPPVTHRGRRALLSTTLSLRRATLQQQHLLSNDAHRGRWSGRGSQLWLSTSFARAAAYGAWATGPTPLASVSAHGYTAQGLLWQAQGQPMIGA